MVFLHQFLEMMVTERGASRSTVSSYETDLCNFYDFLKNRKIEYGTFQDIQSYLLTQKHLSPSTVGRRLSSLRQFYIFLMSREIIKENPFSTMGSAHSKLGHTPFLNEENVKRFLEGAKMWEGPEGKRLSALLQILYATNVPVKDLVALPFTVTLSPLDIIARSVSPEAIQLHTAPELLPPVFTGISPTPAKTRGDEELGIHLQTHCNNVLALEALQEYLKVRRSFLIQGKESPWLFPSLSQQGHLTRQRFGQLLKELALKVGLDSEHISLSKIRNSFSFFNKI